MNVLTKENVQEIQLKIEEINEAITFLLENPEKAYEMGENGKRAVVEQLNWHEEEKKLIAWYKEILNNR